MGVITHGMSKTKEYRAWNSMRRRCLNKNHDRYRIYGGRGISICERWGKFENFYVDMGDKPTKKHSLDRIDNNGNYTPDNCRWATQLVQVRNSRKLRMFYAFNPIGRTYKANNQTLFAKEHNLSQSEITRNLNGQEPSHKGWHFYYADKGRLSL